MSAASSISRVAATQILPSAGTRLPASTRTMSPGTSSSASISIAWPSLRTRAMVFIIWASALTLSSAFDSWRSPITALKKVSPASTTDVPTSPVTSRLTIAATSRTICMKSRYCRRNAWKPDSFLPAASLLGPCALQPTGGLRRTQPLGDVDAEPLGDLGRLDSRNRVTRTDVRLCRHRVPRCSSDDVCVRARDVREMVVMATSSAIRG